MLSTNARVIEVILYIENEPLDIERLQKMTGLNASDIKDALLELQDALFTEHHGIQLIQEENCWSFQVSKDLYENLRKSYSKKVDRRISKAAMETLSIIAYSQPITRVEIDKIRGVHNTDSIIRILRERDYIKKIGHSASIGHAVLWGTTRKFLIDFGIESITDLPKLTDIDRQRFEDKDEAWLPN